MNPFAYERPNDPQLAVNSISGTPASRFLAGGTNLIDLMKNGVEQPQRLIDINRLDLVKVESLPDGGLRLGSLARNADTANHPLVRQHYPLLARAILSGASPQLRNLATNGGNLLQRTRCPYFMDPAFTQCNKRIAGSGCAALEGFNRSHAIFGASEQCIATHPSDMCVALAVLDASIRARGKKGERIIPFTDFHRLPGETPHTETNLSSDELILSIDLPASPYASHSHYLKVRDRASYEFALVSAAVALDVENDRVRSARIALGGVAHKPWRCPEAEQDLIGKTISLSVFASAANTCVAGAKTHRYNKFKVEMAKNAVAQALATAGGLA